MVQAYLATDPDPALYEFLQHDFNTLTSRFGGVAGDHVPEFPVVSAALHAGGRDADRSERPGRAGEAAVTARAVHGRRSADAAVPRADEPARDPQRRASRRITPRPPAADSQAIMRRAPLLLLMALATGCASGGAVPAPVSDPGASAAEPRPPSSPEPPACSPVDRPAVVGTALSLRGAPYRNGGSDPSGFDCSGFVAYVFAQQGLYMPRTVSEQYAQGQPVGPDARRPWRPRVLQHGGSGRLPRRHRRLTGRVRPRPQLQRRRPGRVAGRVLLVLPLRRDAADPVVRGQPAPRFSPASSSLPGRVRTRPISVSPCKH